MTREEFIALISSEQESLRRFLLALCGGDRMEAEDIAQEAMVKAYIASNRFVERHKFSTWLFTIAYNTFLDHKRLARNRETDLDEATFMADSSSADQRFEYQELYAAIDTLPLKEKTAILLFYVSGYDIKEIAKITDSTKIAVKKQLSRGRDKLREILK
ncbi:MAG: RNA polymerase sigma factor [Bacteroidales bacterium]|nr:RNA polymerase sigma factor [Bacteroidales bacterium]